MRLIRYPNPTATSRPSSALAIGNFDGLHRGHRALLAAACAHSDALTPAMMCFEPLPATLFRPDQPVRRILGPRDKIRLARDFGIELMLMMRFTPQFAALEPDAFVEQVIAGTAGARRVIVGEDFRFGARAAGDVEQLQRLGPRHGFEVEVITAVTEADQRISSTVIRESLASGDLARASAQLGRPYSLSGRVLRGQQLGRQLGFPTVNLRPPDPPALSGVLAVRVTGAGLVRQAGVASLGLRPTVAGREWLLEVHLFDYAGDLYGQHLVVECVGYLRPERKFASLDEMTVQMRHDAQQARDLLKCQPPTAAA